MPVQKTPRTMMERKAGNKLLFISTGSKANATGSVIVLENISIAHVKESGDMSVMFLFI